jgi:hypothetical protein
MVRKSRAIEWTKTEVKGCVLSYGVVLLKSISTRYPLTAIESHGTKGIERKKPPKKFETLAPRKPAPENQIVIYG